MNIQIVEQNKMALWRQDKGGRGWAGPIPKQSKGWSQPGPSALVPPP